MNLLDWASVAKAYVGCSFDLQAVAELAFVVMALVGLAFAASWLLEVLVVALTSQVPPSPVDS